jgi:hypothetical protein
MGTKAIAERRSIPGSIPARDGTRKVLRVSGEHQQRRGDQDRQRHEQHEEQCQVGGRERDREVLGQVEHADHDVDQEVQDIDDRHRDADGDDTEHLGAYDVRPRGRSREQRLQRTAFLLPADRVDRHDRTAAQHEEHKERHQRQTEDGSTLTLGARDVLRLDPSDQGKLDRETRALVDAVPYLGSDLRKSVA